MLRRVIATVIAIVVSLVVLVGLVWPISPFYEIRQVVLRWAQVLGAFAFLLAFLSLLRANLRRLRHSGPGRVPSLLIVLAAPATTALILWELRTSGEGLATFGQFMLRHILVPGESTLLALTAVTLVVAILRMLKRRRHIESLLFVLFVILLLIRTLPYVGPLRDVVGWMERVLATAGLRGLVMGVALGTLLTGLRALFMTRPYVDE
jgi:hypothetical protein